MTSKKFAFVIIWGSVSFTVFIVSTLAEALPLSIVSGLSTAAWIFYATKMVRGDFGG